MERACELVDGIPLCIELAASRARHIGLDALLDELGDAIPLMAVGRADRHHSVQSVIAWSHDRLPAEPRVLFDTVSVFAGPFDAAGAASLAGVQDDHAVARVLSELVDQSMVTIEHRGGDARYRLLAPLRDFGRSQLEQSEDMVAVHRRHLEWVVAKAAAADLALRGPAAVAAMASLEALVPELPRARRTIAEGAIPMAMEGLVRALFLFGQEQGRIDLLRAGQPVGAAPIFAASAAVAEWQLGEVAAAAAHASEAVDGATDVLDAGLARLSLAEVCQVRGEHEGAVQLAQEMSELAERGDDPLLATMAHVVQALSYAALGRKADAVRQAGLSAQVSQASGSPLACAWAAYAQGEVRLEDDSGEALDHLDRARALGRAAGSRLLVGVAGLSWVSLRARSSTRTRVAGRVRRDHRALEQGGNCDTPVVDAAQPRPGPRATSADEDAARLHGALMASSRGTAPQGAEGTRLAAAMRGVERRLGTLRFSELVADGANWSDVEVITRARLSCRPGAGTALQDIPR